MKFRSYSLTWFSLGMLLGIGVYIYFTSFTVTAIIAIIVYLMYSKFHYRLFIIGAIYGHANILLQSALIKHSKPLGIEFATECAGTIIGKRCYSVDDKKIYRYEMLLDYFVDINSNIIFGNGWKLTLYTDIQLISNGAYLRAKILPFKTGEPLFDKNLAKYTRFFRYILAKAQIQEILQLENTVKREAQISEPSKSILNSVIRGEPMPTELQDLFDRAGLGYLMSISGIHMAATFMLGYGLLRFFPLYTHTPAQMFCRIIGICVTGLYSVRLIKSWSMIRAFLMIFLPIIIQLFFRRCKSQTSFILSLIFILSIWPHGILDAGFQFSFSAVLALLTSGKGIIRPAINTFIFTLPYTIYHTGFISLYSVPVSIIVGNFFSFIVLPLTIISYLFDYYRILEYGVQIMICMVKIFSSSELIRLPLTAGSILAWTVNIIVFALYENKKIFTMLSIICLAFIERLPNRGIIISRARNEIVFLEYFNLYSSNPKSYFTKECAKKFCVKSVISNIAPFVNENSYQYGNIKIIVNKNGKFLEALMNGECILNQFNIVLQRENAVIDLNGKVSFL